ncbi:MAG: hypothetical protein KDD64_15875 [Bdellovibrionales bacterium]|nr:hypothetical protein [Bdellovibrionales bacterium]
MLVISRSAQEEVLIGEEANPFAFIEVNEIVDFESVEVLLESTTSVLVEYQDGTNFVVQPTNPRHRHAISLGIGDQMTFRNRDGAVGEVRICRITRARARIAFDFPRSISIARLELVEERGAGAAVG